MSAAEPLKSFTSFDFWTTALSCNSIRAGSSMTCQGLYSAPACCSTPDGSASQNFLCGAWSVNGTSTVYNVTSVPSDVQTKYICNNVDSSAPDGTPASEVLLPACCLPSAPQTALAQSPALPPALAPEPNATPSGDSTGAIVGGVVGGVAALAAVSTIAGWCFYRRRRLRSNANLGSRKPLKAMQAPLTNPWATSSGYSGSHLSEGTSSRSGVQTSSTGKDTHTWSDKMFRPPATEGGIYGVLQLSGAHFLTGYMSRSVHCRMSTVVADDQSHEACCD